MVQVIGAIGEWIIGNTFSCAVFFTYGEFSAMSPACEIYQLTGTRDLLDRSSYNINALLRDRFTIFSCRE